MVILGLSEGSIGISTKTPPENPEKPEKWHFPIIYIENTPLFSLFLTILAHIIGKNAPAPPQKSEKCVLYELVRLFDPLSE